MNSATQNIEVRLLGQKIPLRVSHENPELVQDVVALVTALLTETEARAKGSGAASHQIALLALMNLAEEYVTAKHRVKEHQSNLADLGKKSRAVLELLK